ncbi:hypothetical protein AND_001140 [Anopheles darlingi]|uniref:DUF4806 domain-containing protein n=1 Tax=Anopheles darlingi TaxID=43151 RepID=W5JUV1_ANODA|nr:hypothetical protein AND_001140 [Anopheles darlingi]
MVYTKRKRGRPSKELDAQNGNKREKTPVLQAQQSEEEGEEDLVPQASIPDSLQTLLETLSQQAALILEQNARIEQRITCLEQGISRIDQQNGLLELQNDRIEQQIVRIDQRTVKMEEQLSYISTPVSIENRADASTPEKRTTQTSEAATDGLSSADQPFSIRPATTGDEVRHLNAMLGDKAYWEEATKWLDWNVYEDKSRDRMNKTVDLLISPALQTKCYWNSALNDSKMPLLKSQRNILNVIKHISATHWETVTDAAVEEFVARKIRLARRNQTRQGTVVPRSKTIRVTVNSCDETSVELDENTSIDSSIESEDIDNDQQQQRQEQTHEINEEKLIKETHHTWNDDDTSLDLDEDDLDSIDDELEEIEFE